MSEIPLSGSALYSLLPLMTLSGAIVTLLLVIPYCRCARLSYGVALAGLAATLAMLPVVYPLLPQQATPLLLMDGAALLFMGLILGGALLLLSLSHDYWLQQPEQTANEYYLLLLLAVLGALVLVASNHFASFFIGLELLSLPLVVMIAYPFQRSSAPPLEAGIKYLVLSAAASATLLFGIALIYAASGKLAFAPLPDSANPLLLAGLMLLLAGIAFKLSLVPFHLWTPDVYQGAPLPATALLATLAKVALFAALLRYCLTSEALNLGPVSWALGLLAAASMLAGNLLALLQRNLKRLLAYSSIGQFGYLLVGLLAIGPSASGLAVEALGYYLVAYLFSTLAAFAVLLRLQQSASERVELEDCHGLFWRQPGLATLMTLALLSLAGIPLTIGFIGKFYLFAAALEQSLWWLLVVLVVASAIGLFYYLRVILVMARGAAEPAADVASRPQPSLVAQRPFDAVVALLALVTLWLGVYPSPLIELIRHLGLGVN